MNNSSIEWLTKCQSQTIEISLLFSACQKQPMLAWMCLFPVTAPNNIFRLKFHRKKFNTLSNSFDTTLKDGNCTVWCFQIFENWWCSLLVMDSHKIWFSKTCWVLWRKHLSLLMVFGQTGCSVKHQSGCCDDTKSGTCRKKRPLIPVWQLDVPWLLKSKMPFQQFIGAPLFIQAIASSFWPQSLLHFVLISDNTNLGTDDNQIRLSLVQWLQIDVCWKKGMPSWHAISVHGCSPSIHLCCELVKIKSVWFSFLTTQTWKNQSRQKQLKDWCGVFSGFFVECWASNGYFCVKTAMIVTKNRILFVGNTRTNQTKTREPGDSTVFLNGGVFSVF